VRGVEIVEERRESNQQLAGDRSVDLPELSISRNHAGIIGGNGGAVNRSIGV
jgi:hypothetical protein